MAEQPGRDTPPPAPAAALSREQAQIILKADLANLARKVQAGRTLNVAERNLLQSALGGGELSDDNYVGSAVELAKVLGVERKTIARWRRQPGNPGVEADGRYPVHAWRAWAAAHRRGGGAEDELSQTQLRARHVLLQNQKLEIQLAILRRDFIPASDVERWGAELGSAIRKVVTQVHLAAPSVVGLSVAEAEVVLKQLEDEILGHLHLLKDRLEEERPADEPAA